MSEFGKHGLGHLISRARSAQVRRADASTGKDALYGPFNLRGRVCKAEVIEHHSTALDSGDRVDYSLARDIGGRAMYRLEHRWIATLRVQVRAGSQAHAADDDGRNIAEDVAEEV